MHVSLDLHVSDNRNFPLHFGAINEIQTACLHVVPKGCVLTWDLHEGSDSVAGM